MPINIDGSKGIRQNTAEVTKIPVGTTAQRPANPEEGMMRFNTDEGQVERYDGISWGSIDLGELLAAVSEAADIDEAVSFVGRGAIVESGTNSNGSFVRWENGEQVCWGQLTNSNLDFDLSTSSGVFLSRSNRRTFAASFVDSNYSMHYTLIDSDGGSNRQFFGTSMVDAKIALSFDFRMAHVDGSRSGVAIEWDYLAWGFWK